jgi:quercetin dioxygenase-like cupin family protein
MATLGSRAEEASLNSWDVASLNLKPRLPEILSSTDDARAVALDLAEGQRLPEHEVHERAWVVVLAGEVQATAGGERVVGGPGLLLEFAPRERHELVARSQARLLLLLTPWPGAGHPGAMSVREKLYARRHAAKQGS